MIGQTAIKNNKQQNYGGGLTALYARLSKDDELIGDSNSIVHQKEMLAKYAKEHGFTNIEYYIDDGYSGTNFNRPDFQRMMSDVEEGKISTVIVKDMSRFGRNYIMVGYYTEILFPNAKVRFIAVSDGVDSISDYDNEFTPFRNIINEWYARDTSKKVKAVIRAKGMAGKHLTAVPPYGYIKDPNDKTKWIVDTEAAEAVKRVYEMYLSGMVASQIAKALTADGEDIYKMGADYRAKIGYMPQQQSLYEAFTAEKFLWYMAALKGMNRKDAREQIENLLEVVNLKEERYKKLKYFSGGMKQRILLAQALLNDPEILILDEPTAGMDPEERIRIRNFISGCAKDKIVLLATHVVADVENMAREILLIKNGKIVRRDTPQKLLAELEHKVYNVLVTEREGEEYQNSGARIISVTLTEKGHRLRIISADALKTGNVEEVYPCLEDVYLYWIDRE